LFAASRSLILGPPPSFALIVRNVSILGCGVKDKSAPAASPQHSLRLRILHGVVFCNLTNEHSLGRSFPCFDMVDPYWRWLTNCLNTRGKMIREYLHSPPPCRGSTPEAWTLLPYTWSFRSCGQASLHVHSSSNCGAKS
jgi:hypothetical protein